MQKELKKHKARSEQSKDNLRPKYLNLIWTKLTHHFRKLYTKVTKQQLISVPYLDEDFWCKL